MQAPTIDPVALAVGPFEFRWYGIMYMLAFAAGWLLARWRVTRPGSGWTKENMDDLLTWVMLGVILGGRLGFVLFYDLPAYMSDPTEIFRIWNGGMSFHGGLLGVLVAFWWYARRNGRTFLEVSDFVAPLIPPGLFFGRIGNFINGELWGHVSTVPWAMIFPHAGPYPRHPSQLYEAALEGLVLFGMVWIFSQRRRPAGAVSGLFALGYGVFRFSVEFVRMPDANLGYLAFGWLTMGQLLCLPLMAVGAWLLLRHGMAALPANAPASTGKADAKPMKNRSRKR